ncbi:helix-turn-helix transcriptional regulator [Apilactobacillus xinyiensis]|uniref:helix-turn-helix transcriptional regulator n=1 Tax=Apilactobacillus xinyiensis TaxID=2841032 RepID=UPI001C7CC328|nr:helix-turn-helix transcriptional regulator [Apilactobacillus xinyiensis]MCL0330787.1 helix-turn-helix domain-containing protein [Apilactobacillus xinyiensis]
MNLGKQIKKYRYKYNYSQDDLSEKIFVSRQTISNWENDKSYPDVNSLLLLSTTFDVSLDDLIKGDLDLMKEKVTNIEDRKKFNLYSWIMLVSCILSAISVGPMILSDVFVFRFVPLMLMMPVIYCSILIETLKKSSDVKTYREVLAYSKGKPIHELRQQRSKLSYFFEKVSILFLFTVSFILIALLSIWLTIIFI